jgi:hypothetical protein
MKLRLLFAFLALLACIGAASAEEQAFTNRSTDLKDRASADAKTVATLAENTAVKVLQRGGGWTKVDASGKTGWVRVFHLRFAAVVEQGSQSTGGGFLSGISAALSSGSPAKPTTIATTGIRGLSPDDLKNASPNLDALAKANSYRADKPSAERFARDGKLASVKVDDPQGGSR